MMHGKQHGEFEADAVALGERSRPAGDSLAVSASQPNPSFGLPPLECEVRGQSRRWWVGGILAVLALQLLLIFITARNGTEDSTSDLALEKLNSRSGPAVVVVADSIAGRGEESAALGAVEPGLLVGPNIRGFSGNLWTDLQRPSYGFGGWQERSSGLEHSAIRPARIELETRLEKHGAHGPLTPKPPPDVLEGARVEVPIQIQSSWEIRGGLGQRPLLTSVQLPELAGTEVLGRTLVEVLVAPDGFVLSSRVIAGCGSREMDAQAQRIVRRARFGPVSRARPGVEALQFGEWIFKW